MFFISLRLITSKFSTFFKFEATKVLNLVWLNVIANVLEKILPLSNICKARNLDLAPKREKYCN